MIKVAELWPLQATLNRAMNETFAASPEEVTEFRDEGYLLMPLYFDLVISGYSFSSSPGNCRPDQVP
jgi:hypothetical protein